MAYHGIQGPAGHGYWQQAWLSAAAFKSSLHTCTPSFRPLTASGLPPLDPSTTAMAMAATPVLLAGSSPWGAPQSRSSSGPQVSLTSLTYAIHSTCLAVWCMQSIGSFLPSLDQEEIDHQLFHFEEFISLLVMSFDYMIMREQNHYFIESALKFCSKKLYI